MTSIDAPAAAGARRGRAPGRLARPRAGRGDRGAALVEFAAVVGVLVFLVLGVVSYGVILAVQHGLDEAAAEAARAGALAWDDPVTTEDERIETARASLDSAGVDCAPGGAVTCAVDIDPCSGDPARDCLTVTLTHDREVDSIVGRLPLLEGVLPDELVARATAMVNP